MSCEMSSHGDKSGLRVAQARLHGAVRSQGRSTIVGAIFDLPFAFWGSIRSCGRRMRTKKILFFLVAHSPSVAFGAGVSLRLGHARALTRPRRVIHYPRAASLPPGGSLSKRHLDQGKSFPQSGGAIAESRGALAIETPPLHRNAALLWSGSILQTPHRGVAFAPLRMTRGRIKKPSPTAVLVRRVY